MHMCFVVCVDGRTAAVAQVTLASHSRTLAGARTTPMTIGSLKTVSNSPVMDGEFIIIHVALQSFHTYASQTVCHNRSH